MPREERFGIGKKIDESFLSLLDSLRRASFERLTEKVEYLTRAQSHTDEMRFFLQLAWEARLFEQKAYVAIAQDIEEIGRMIGGWRRGLITKTPAR